MDGPSSARKLDPYSLTGVGLTEIGNSFVGVISGLEGPVFDLRRAVGCSRQAAQVVIFAPNKCILSLNVQLTQAGGGVKQIVGDALWN